MVLGISIQNISVGDHGGEFQVGLITSLTLIGLGFFYMLRFGGDAAPCYLRCLWTYRNEILYKD